MANDNQALLLQVSADTSKAEKRLDAFIQKLNGIPNKIGASGGKTQTALDKIFGSPEAAAKQIFDSSRLKILDSGIARVGVFGGAIEKLGIAGLGAAAGIGALAFALSQAGDAVKFAAEIDHTAESVHVTTDFLQQLRFALKAVGSDEHGAEQALGSFSAMLGKASANVPKAVAAFKELFGNSFTAADAKKLGDPQEALLKVATKISNLKSPEQRDAIVSQLGLDGLKELVENVDKLKKGLDDASASGNVFSADLILKAKGLQEEIDKIDGKINIEMKSAFIGLGPVILSLKDDLDQLLTKLLQIIDSFRSLPNKSDIAIQKDRADTQAKIAELQSNGTITAPSAVANLLPGLPKTITTPLGGRARQAAIDKLQAHLGQLDSEDIRRVTSAADAAADEAAQKRRTDEARTGALTPRPTKGTGPSAASQQKTFDAELAKIAEQILSASDDDLHTLLERQDIARQRLSIEDNAKRISIEDQVGTKAITAAHGKALILEQDKLLLAKSTQLQAEQEKAVRELALRVESDLVSAATDVLNAQIGIAHTAKDRAALEAEIYDAQREIARNLKIEALRDDPNLDDAQRLVIIAQFDAATAYQKGAKSLDTWAKLAEDQARTADATANAQIDALQLQDQLAETAKERRDVELKILEAQYRLQRATLLQAIAVENDPSKVGALQTQLKSLDDNHAGQVELTNRNTRGPLEAFLAQTDTVQKLNEQLEALSVQGLQDVNDGIAGLITGTEKWGDVSKRVLGDILAGLIKLELQQAEAAFLPSVTSFLGGLPGIGSLFGGHRAGGGPVSSGQFYQVGEKGPEWFAPGVSGSIIPNSAVRAVSAMSGGGLRQTVVNEFHLHAEGAVMTKELINGLRQDAWRMSQQAGAIAAQTALNGVPARIIQQQKHGQ